MRTLPDGRDFARSFRGLRPARIFRREKHAVLSVRLPKAHKHLFGRGRGQIFADKIGAEGQLPVPRSTISKSCIFFGRPSVLLSAMSAEIAARTVRPVYKTSSQSTSVFPSMEKSICVPFTRASQSRMSSRYSVMSKMPRGSSVPALSRKSRADAARRRRPACGCRSTPPPRGRRCVLRFRVQAA